MVWKWKANWFGHMLKMELPYWEFNNRRKNERNKEGNKKQELLMISRKGDHIIE